MNHLKQLKSLSAAIAILFLAACSDNSDPVAQLPDIQLSAEQLAKYEASCKVCHDTENTGAPLRGDTQAWSTILKKPMDAIMQNVVNGYQGMPPLGQCFDCDETDLKSLVYYLATPTTPKTH